ncbi:MAG: hypothetical protein A2W80_19380 [Candidatus Riflebacteria bacterium GWC2_50_8]|nr:MAG: hypothetical protein A2W80_19380 [Candidatus Riflebacteria bacterium GWC2_50_8]
MPSLVFLHFLLSLQIRSHSHQKAAVTAGRVKNITAIAGLSHFNQSGGKILWSIKLPGTALALLFTAFEVWHQTVETSLQRNLAIVKLDENICQQGGRPQLP